MRACFLGFALIAQLCPGAATTNTIQLSPIVVTASRAPSTTAPASFSLIDWSSLRLSNPAITIEEPLRRVPGVFVQNSFNFAQDQRIAIRGFGTRAAFGVREIKLLVDGIPESSPDGQTQLDNLDLGSVRHFEVLRGPAAALYGNASGGVINILTDDHPGTPFIETRMTGGSHGVQRHQLKGGDSLGPVDYRFTGSWSSIDGYRQHAKAESWFFGGKARIHLNDQSSLSTHFNYASSPWAQDAGGLTRAELDSNRRQSRARNVILDAGEEVHQGRLSLIYRNELTPGHTLTLNQYTVLREFANKLPILPAAGDGIVKFARLGVGGGLKHVWDTPANRLITGVDLEFQTDDRQRYANLAGNQGALGLDQQESVLSIGPFLRNEYRLNDTIQLTAGLRYDNVRFDADDRFLADGDDSGSRPVDQLSWSTGGQLQARTNIQLFASIGTAFQTPTTTELANPTGGGGFNPVVQPQTSVTYEIGCRAELTSHLKSEISLFHTQISDELIPFTSPSGRDFFRNAGRSKRSGIELSLDLEISPGWNWLSSYTIIDSRYQDYVTAGGTFSGNREPGIPAHQLFTEISWQSTSGFFGGLDLQFVDQFHLNDANTAKNEAYTLLNCRLGYTASIGRAKLTPFVAVNNLLNQRYNGQTRLNAFGGRFFEPTPRLTAYGGLTLKMEF